MREIIWRFVLVTFVVNRFLECIELYEPVPNLKPTDCLFASEYYDIKQLKCVQCPANSECKDRKLFLSFHLNLFVY